MTPCLEVQQTSPQHAVQSFRRAGDDCADGAFVCLAEANGHVRQSSADVEVADRILSKIRVRL